MSTLTEEHWRSFIEREYVIELDMEDIKSAVCGEAQLPREVVFGKSRIPDIVNCRQLAQTIAVYTLGGSFRSIGLAFGRVTHSSVCNSIKVTKNLYQTDKDFKQFADRVLGRINQRHISEELAN